MLLLKLFWEFFKTGLFSVGGGMATLPFLYDMSYRHPDWFSISQLADMVAVSESTPGPIGVNMATYVGITAAGVPGALAATIGLITPEIIVILIISGILTRFRKSRYVEGAFYGIRPCSVAMIAAAGLLLVKLSFFNGTALASEAGFVEKLVGYISAVKPCAVLLAAVLLILTRVIPKTKALHPVYFIIFSAVIGAVLSF